jgi:hypothetical protein
MNRRAEGLITTAGAVLLSLAFFGPAAAQAKSTPLTTLTVDNTRDVPVVVYLERGDFDMRLGTVNAHTTQSLNLPTTIEDGEEIQVFVHPEGGIDLATQELTVKRGGNLSVLVPTNETGYVPPEKREIAVTPDMGKTTLTVENDRKVPVTVFIQEGDFDTRIGTIPAQQEQTLTIPERLTREDPEAEVFVHPEGQGDLASWYLKLKSGSHLFVRVPV